MRKLLNTIYITNENAYLSLEGELLVCDIGEERKFKIPFDNIEAVVCFSYPGCSPAVMGKCVEKLIPISFHSPNGKFLAKVGSNTRGNVFLRAAQIDLFRQNALLLAQNTVASKLHNSLSVIRRSCHDDPALRTLPQITEVKENLKKSSKSIYEATSVESLMGMEGNAASEYFSIYGKLFSNKEIDFTYRSKRPPLDPVNAVLSFLYSVYTGEFASALETVGLDSYFGFYHSLRSGRASLACDLVEECRCLVDRFTLSLFNLRILTAEDFEPQKTGAVYLNDDGRKKVLTRWQEKKRTDIVHPFLKQKIQFGLLPYVQANLLAKYVRGEIAEYPCYLYFVS